MKTQLTSIILLSIALTFVLARTVIRLRLQKRLFIDDAFLFLGVICLCASVGVIWGIPDGIFADDSLIYDDYHSSYYLITLGSHEGGGLYIILIYITIYFVKLSFLVFFRNLVRRDRKMTIYWWTVLAITFVALPISIIIAVVCLCWIFGMSHSTVSLFMFCFGIKAERIVVLMACPSLSVEMSIGLLALGTVLDVVTDILRKFDSAAQCFFFMNLIDSKFSSDHTLRTTLACSDQFATEIFFGHHSMSFDFHDYFRYHTSFQFMGRI